MRLPSSTSEAEPKKFVLNVKCILEEQKLSAAVTITVLILFLTLFHKHQKLALQLGLKQIRVSKLVKQQSI